MPPVVRDDLTGVIPGKPADMAQGPTDPVTGEIDVFSSVGAPSERRLYIVTMSEDARPLSDRAREVLGAVAPDALFTNLGMFTVELTDAQAAALARRPGVAGVEADQVVSLNLPDQDSVEAAKGKPGGGGTTTPPALEILDWGVNAVWGGTDRREDLPLPYSGKVFVLDTGISSSTGDLNFNQSLSRDFTGSRSGFYDKNGHGTHVAGTIAAIANNGRGIVGVAAGAEVVAFKVLNDRGSGTTSGIIAALEAVIDVANVGDVVNMSLGGGFSSALNYAVVKAANSGKNIRFAIAAGNESRDVDLVSPASTGDPRLGIYVVSAHDKSGKNASFTNYDNFGGDDLDNVAFAAPGVSILSLAIDGSTRTLSGTSMASPHVAGILLLGGFRGDAGSASAFGTEMVDPFAVSSYWG